MTGHAYALLDSYVYGFALQEANLPATNGEEIGGFAETMVEPMFADVYPNLMEFTVEHLLQPDYDFREEFEFGLDVILKGLETAAANQ